MELKGKLADIRMVPRNRKYEITFEIEGEDNALACWEKFRKAKKCDITIQRSGKKPSRNAYSYAWVLIRKLAHKLGCSETEMYLKMLHEYGYSEVFSIEAGKEIGRFCKYYKLLGSSKLKGKIFDHYRIYEGSSQYSQEQMRKFIEGIVSEAKGMQIETLPPDDLAHMLAEWQNEPVEK